MEELTTAFEELRVMNEGLCEQNENLAQARDISERHGRHYREFFEGALDGYLVTDAKGVISEANRTAATLLGVRQPYLSGKALAVFIAPEDRELFGLHLTNLQKRGPLETVGWKLRLKRRDKLTVTILARVSRGAQAAGERASVHWMLRDITDHQRLVRQMLEVSDREQTRIGQDLHDVLGQHLAGIGFLSGALASRLAAKCLPEAKEAAEINQLIGQAMIQTRSIARGLCPVELSATDLERALENYAAHITHLYSVKCSFRANRTGHFQDTFAAGHLYHIAQEAVYNAVRHGEARRIQIGLGGFDECVVLSIRDDGKGLPQDYARRAGLGMHTMRLRAETIGATLELKSEPGSGTVVTCSLPRTRLAG